MVEKYIAALNIRDEIRINIRESIDNYEMHASLNYLIITTTDGIFRLFSFKTRTFIQDNQMNMRIKHSCFDPSGLYVIAGGISPKKIRQTLSLNCKSFSNVSEHNVA